MPLRFVGRRIFSLLTLTVAAIYCFKMNFMLRIISSAETRLLYCKRDERMKKIIAKSKVLSSPIFTYRPPFWAVSGWINLAVFMIKTKVFKFLGLAKLKRQTIKTEDNGLVSIDWMDDEITRGLPKDAPILIVLHTVTGNGPNTWDFLRHIPSYGWRACVFNRRGCADMELTTPKFSVMGCIHDTRRQVEEVRNLYPESCFVGMAGLSAGSGLVITYLGREGSDAPIDAAVSLSPAYDVSKAFKNLADKYPVADKKLLRSHDEDSFDALMACETIHDFFERSSTFAGYRDFEHFCELNNPMKHYTGIECPTLVLNAEDDPVCTKENIRHDLAENTHNFALVLTSTGSHVSFVDGIFGEKCWMTSLTIEFMNAVKAVKLEESNTKKRVIPIE